MTAETDRVTSLAPHGDHEHAVPIRHDLLAELRWRSTDVGAADEAELDLAVDQEGEADCVLLFADESGGAIDWSFSWEL